MDYQPGLKAILDNSGTLVTWALAVGGASVAAMISTSYERPKTWRGRLIYLLFPLAWLFLGISVYEGQQISKRYIAAQLVCEQDRLSILRAMSSDFSYQSLMLITGLAVLFAWLLWFVAWWIWCAPNALEKKHSAAPPSRRKI
jgi:hypothetical protein